MPQNTSDLINALKTKDMGRFVELLMDGFEESMDQQQTARMDYLGGIQESNQAYLSGLEGLGAQREQAVAEYQRPHQMGTGEKILMGASAALPLISMAMKPGRGRDVVGGAGALAAGIQRGGIQTRRRAKEEGLRLDLGGLGQEAELLGARHKLGTGYAGAEYDTQVDEYPRMLEMARTVKGFLPKPEKEPTTIEAVVAGYLDRGEEVPPEIMRIYREKLAGKPSMRQSRIPPNIAQQTRSAYGTALGKWEGGKRAWDKAQAPSTAEAILGEASVAKPYTEPQPTLGGIYDSSYRDYAVARGLDPDSIANVLGLGGQREGFIGPQTPEAAVGDITSNVVAEIMASRTKGDWIGNWPLTESDWQQIAAQNPGLDIERAKQSLGLSGPVRQSRIRSMSLPPYKGRQKP